MNDGMLKIADFGFSRNIDDFRHQILNSYVGSPLYMAPQILVKGNYTNKCDVWSLGIIIY